MTKKEVEAANKARIQAEETQIEAKQLRAVRKANLRELSEVSRCIEGVCTLLLDAESPEKSAVLDKVMRTLHENYVTVLCALVEVLGPTAVLGDDAMPVIPEGGLNND